MHQVVEQLHGRAGRAARRAARGGLQVHQVVEQLHGRAGRAAMGGTFYGVAGGTFWAFIESPTIDPSCSPSAMIRCSSAGLSWIA